MTRHNERDASSRISESKQRAEKRKYPRFEYPFFVRYKKDGKEFKKENVDTVTLIQSKEMDSELTVSKDLSIGGICFVTREHFPIHTELVLEIFAPTRADPFLASTKVVWQKKITSASDYLTGVQFLYLNDKKGFKGLLKKIPEIKYEEVKENGKFSL